MARYSNPDTKRLDRTRLNVELFRGDGEFVSRTEAKVIGANLEGFDVIELDFAGIEQIGQGFADQLFRLGLNDHPTAELVPLDAQRHRGDDRRCREVGPRTLTTQRIRRSLKCLTRDFVPPREIQLSSYEQRVIAGPLRPRPDPYVNTPPTGVTGGWRLRSDGRRGPRCGDRDVLRLGRFRIVGSLDGSTVQGPLTAVTRPRPVRGVSHGASVRAGRRPSRRVRCRGWSGEERTGARNGGYRPAGRAASCRWPWPWWPWPFRSPSGSRPHRRRQPTRPDRRDPAFECQR
jgi:hypothetical protein